MMERIEGLPDGTVGFRGTGRITAGDYDAVLIPGIEEALEQHERVRLFCQLGPGFEGYDLEAAWDDARVGLRHWAAYERIALVTDVGWIRTAIRALGFAMPCPIRVFGLDEAEDARRWLAESLGSIHLEFDDAAALIKVRLLGELEPSAYRGVAEQLDAFIARQGRIRLLLDLREFDGWQGLQALGEHLSLVRDHRRAPERVALVGEAAWERRAARLAGRFLDAEVRYFTAARYADAEAWAVEPARPAQGAAAHGR